MKKEDVLKEIKKCLQEIHHIQYWAQIAQNPIFNVDEEGNRTAKSLFDLEKGFIEYYKDYSNFISNKTI